MKYVRFTFSYNRGFEAATLLQMTPVESGFPFYNSLDGVGYHLESRNQDGEKLHQIGAYGAFAERVESFSEDPNEIPIWVPSPSKGVFTVLMPDHPEMDHVVIKKIEPEHHVSLMMKELQAGMLSPPLVHRDIGKFKVIRE